MAYYVPGEPHAPNSAATLVLMAAMAMDRLDHLDPEPGQLNKDEPGAKSFNGDLRRLAYLLADIEQYPGLSAELWDKIQNPNPQTDGLAYT